MNNPLIRAAGAAWVELSTEEAQEWYMDVFCEFVLVINHVGRRAFYDTILLGAIAWTLFQGSEESEGGPQLLLSAMIEVPEAEVHEVDSPICDYSTYSIADLRAICKALEVSFSKTASRSVLIRKLNAVRSAEIFELN